MSNCPYCKNWEDIAAQHCRNERYYRDLLVEIGVMFGDDAFIALDGSRPGGVLCAKVPSLVASLIEESRHLKWMIRPPQSPSIA